MENVFKRRWHSCIDGYGLLIGAFDNGAPTAYWLALSHVMPIVALMIEGDIIIYDLTTVSKYSHPLSFALERGGCC